MSLAILQKNNYRLISLSNAQIKLLCRRYLAFFPASVAPVDVSCTFDLQYEYLETPCAVSGTTDPEAEKTQTWHARTRQQTRSLYKAMYKEFSSQSLLELKYTVNYLGFWLPLTGFSSFCFCPVFPVIPSLLSLPTAFSA